MAQQLPIRSSKQKENLGSACGAIYDFRSPQKTDSIKISDKKSYLNRINAVAFLTDYLAS